MSTIEQLEGQIKELKDALRIASSALSIASDWNVEHVQVNPPKFWELDAGDEDASDGWCTTYALSEKLLELSQ